MSTDTEFQKLNTQYQTLRNHFKTLLLATTTLDGTPEISYAPFVCDTDGVLYIYISELALHTANLIANPKASVLFIQDEGESANLFARARISLNCIVQEITQSNPLYNQQLQAMHTAFGEIIQLISSLNDFHLFALQPIQGRYVAGFGRAYTLDIHNNCLAENIRGT